MSRLINWSALPDFAPQTLALLLFALAAGALFFVGSGLLTSLTGWRIFSALVWPVGVVGLGAGAVFFSYSAAQYYRYAAALRHEGHPLTVTVLRAERHEERQSTRSYGLYTLTYTASFRYGGLEREVAIEEADYDRLTAGDSQLAVHYEPTRNDFIAAGYSPHWSALVPALFFWGMLGWALWPTAARRPATQPAHP